MAKAMTKVNASEDSIVTEEKKTKRVFEQSDGVRCISITQGALYVEGAKTGMLYNFADYGDETEIEYRDLVALIRTKDKAIYEPRFVVDDEDFIAEYPALKKYYNEEFSMRNIRDILDYPENKMIEAIKQLPSGALNSLKSIAAEQVATGQIDSVRKIKALDSVFGTDLNLLGEILAN